MRDEKVSLPRINTLHPKVRAEFKLFVEDCENTFNITIRVVQALRTIEEQNELYAQGRTKPGNIVTKARGGSSYHNYGLAIDIVPIINGKVNWNYNYETLLPIAEKYNLEWGGNFHSIKDEPHFQDRLGYTWQQLYKMYRLNKFIQGSKYLDI